MLLVVVTNYVKFMQKILLYIIIPKIAICLIDLIEWNAQFFQKQMKIALYYSYYTNVLCKGRYVPTF